MLGTGEDQVGLRSSGNSSVASESLAVETVAVSTSRLSLSRCPATGTNAIVRTYREGPSDQRSSSALSSALRST